MEDVAYSIVRVARVDAWLVLRRVDTTFRRSVDIVCEQKFGERFDTTMDSLRIRFRVRDGTRKKYILRYAVGKCHVARRPRYRCSLCGIYTAELLGCRCHETRQMRRDCILAFLVWVVLHTYACIAMYVQAALSSTPEDQCVEG